MVVAPAGIPHPPALPPWLSNPVVPVTRCVRVVPFVYFPAGDLRVDEPTGGDGHVHRLGVGLEGGRGQRVGIGGLRGLALGVGERRRRRLTGRGAHGGHSGEGKSGGQHGGAQPSPIRSSLPSPSRASAVVMSRRVVGMCPRQRDIYRARFPRRWRRSTHWNRVLVARWNVDGMRDVRLAVVRQWHLEQRCDEVGVDTSEATAR